MRACGALVYCVVALLAGCVSAPHTAFVACPREAALSRGLRDGALGNKMHLQFTRSCSLETREIALSAYRQGFEASRLKRRSSPMLAKDGVGEAGVTNADLDVDTEDATAFLSMPSVARAPSAVSWVCEIEASSKVFTGVGDTQDEALGSARANCGSHFQASSCTKSDCRQSM